MNASPGTGGTVVVLRTGLSPDQTPYSVGAPSVNPSPLNVTQVKASYRPISINSVSNTIIRQQWLHTWAERTSERCSTIYLSSLGVDGQGGIFTTSLAIVGNVNQHTRLCRSSWESVSVKSRSTGRGKFDANASRL